MDTVAHIQLMVNMMGSLRPYSHVIDHTIGIIGTNHTIFLFFFDVLCSDIYELVCDLTLFWWSLWWCPQIYRAIYLPLYMCTSPAICLFHHIDHSTLCNFYVTPTHTIHRICLYFHKSLHDYHVVGGYYILCCGSYIMLATSLL